MSLLQSALLPRFARFARRLTLATCLAVAPLAVGATPQTLSGSQDPAFIEAFNTWLADDEAAALPALSDLAQSGNAAAQILLGLIDKSPSLQGPYLAHLTRAQRLEILREPGGISGISWLTRVADTPLISAWMALWDVSVTPAVVENFTALGELRAARAAMITLAAREHPAMRAIDPNGTDKELLYLLWPPANADRRRLIEELVPPAHPQRLLMGQSIDAREVDVWLSTSPAAAPIAALCQVVCPEAGATCRVTAYRALNSHNALLTLGTPSEALVSQDDFLASARGRGTVMRRILLAADMRGRRALLASVREHSECLAEALTAENQRYLPRLPAVPEQN